MEKALTVRTSVMGIADEGPIKGEAAGGLAGDSLRLPKVHMTKKSISMPGLEIAKPFYEST